jgi:hypothetical protein
VEGRDPELTLYLTAWPPESATPEAIASALAPYGAPSFVAYDGMYPYSQVRLNHPYLYHGVGVNYSKYM